ncbi:unnamed protein product, partial [Clonostachys rosea f. rosea IK726]
MRRRRARARRSSTGGWPAEAHSHPQPAARAREENSNLRHRALLTQQPGRRLQVTDEADAGFHLRVPPRPLLLRPFRAHFDQ